MRGRGGGLVGKGWGAGGSSCVCLCIYSSLSVPGLFDSLSFCPSVYPSGGLPDCLFPDCLTVRSCACLFLCVISSMGSECLTVHPFVAVRVSVCPDSSLSVGWLL